MLTLRPTCERAVGMPDTGLKKYGASPRSDGSLGMVTRKTPYSTEISTWAEFEVHLAAFDSFARTVISGLDLRIPEVEKRVLAVSFDDALLLGCRLTPELSIRVKQTGGMIFPFFEDLPFDPYRSGLYSVSELMEGYVRGRPESLGSTSDAQIYNYYKALRARGHVPSVLETLACRIHDHAIDRALDDVLHPSGGEDRRVVGIMGGHKLRRDDPGYLSVSRIARRLTRSGLYVATGGGPGAMEAGNLGAWFADKDEQDLDAAVAVLGPDPSYMNLHYVDRGYDVLDMHPAGQASLAVPTWFYGHEPSNLFSTSVAKYFANSIREDGLLAIATFGVIFSPGSAGTIQEIFLDAAQNHYASLKVVSPMVFLGVEYWTRNRPVFPLLESMSADKPYAKMIAITDNPAEAVEFILTHQPFIPG